VRFYPEFILSRSEAKAKDLLRDGDADEPDLPGYRLDAVPQKILRGFAAQN
jgi:hypothetical protein